MGFTGFVILMLGLGLVTFGATNNNWFANPALGLGTALTLIGLLTMIVNIL